MNRRRTGALGGLVLVAACSAETQEEAGAIRTAEQPVIYGQDDRTDWYAVEDPALRDLTRYSIVAYVSSTAINESNPDAIRLSSRTLVETMRLCPTERFATQPTAASCSATLIDDDLVLTAGHCVSSRQACTSARFVFRYYMESETQLATIEAEDVFRCAEVLVRNEGFTRNGTFDHGIVRLDRPATPRHRPAVVSTDRAAVRVGDPVTIIGFGSGLPAKVDTGGRVTSVRSQGDYFEATTDSFGGNSGSGVFNAANEVVGILVRGQQDYQRSGSCMVPVRLPEDGTRRGSEGISFAWRAIDELCSGGHVSPRLCGNEPVCGDGLCSPGETGCDADCGAGVPAAWACDPTFYGTGDGCDCTCGAWDPDCEDPSQDVLNCAPGEVCLSSGLCGSTGGGGGGGGGPVENPTVPDEWNCDPAWYGALDGCDCDCGAIDPDCDVPGQQLIHCMPGQICSSAGLCVDGASGGGGASDDAGERDDAGGGDGVGIDDGAGADRTGGRGTSGCAAALGGSGSGVPVAWLVVVGALGVVRQRRTASARTCR